MIRNSVLQLGVLQGDKKTVQMALEIRNRDLHFFKDYYSLTSEKICEHIFLKFNNEACDSEYNYNKNILTGIETILSSPHIYMQDTNKKLQQQINDAISIQQILLDKLALGVIADDSDKITIDICQKIVTNAIAINRFDESISEFDDNELYENYIKSLDNKDIKIY